MLSFLEFITEKFNKQDIYNYFKIDDKYTVSFEFELESNPEKNTILTNLIDQIDKRKDKLSKQLEEEIQEEFKFDQFILKLINRDVLGSIEWEYTESVIEELKDWIVDIDYIDKPTKTKLKRFITNFYKKNAIRKTIETPKTDQEVPKLFHTKENLIIQYFPNFWDKWGSQMSFAEDITLTMGIEFRPQLYVEGLSNGIQLWNDFYSDYEKQDFWVLNEHTGLHINLGIKDNEKWNLTKAFIFMSDKDQEGFVFKDMDWRAGNKYCGSFRPIIIKYLLELNKKHTIDLQHLDFQQLVKIEKLINKRLYETVKKFHKDYGLNFKYLVEKNYMEYRYVGGSLTRELVIDKLKYFAYITFLMYDDEYKKHDYYKKLYKFVDESLDITRNIHTVVVD